MDWIGQHLSIFLFIALAVLLFTGYPVAFVLGGIAILFGALGMAFGVFEPMMFFNLLPRIWGGIAANPILVAVPMFIFMGTVLERSGVANDLLHALQVITRRIPGGLAMSVTLMGTIMAATTGIVGASVVMLTLVALPPMMQRGYQKELAVGTIASAGTLGILIPPSIMLVIMGDLMQVSVGTLFAAAVFPGLLLSFLYLAYIGHLESSTLFPEVLLDPAHDRTTGWNADDHFYHVSATACHHQGQYGVFDDCQALPVEWSAHPLMTAGPPETDTIEVAIPWFMLGVAPEPGDTIGFCALLTNTVTTWNEWPTGADRDSPGTWGQLVFPTGAGIEEAAAEGSQR